MFCPNCGMNCNDNDVVCGNCGTPLRANPNPAYGAAPVSKAPASEKVKDLGKKLTGNKTILYAAIGVVALVLVILLASLIFRNPAGSVALKYWKYESKGEFLKADKLTVFNYQDFADDYEKYARKYMDDKFDLEDYYDDAKDDRIDSLEKIYGSNYKFKKVKVAYVYNWEEKDVKKWVKANEDRKVLDNEDLEDYVEFDKVKKIATVYISGVVEGKKDGRAFMASYDVIKIGGKWRIADAPCGYGMYFYDDDDD